MEYKIDIINVSTNFDCVSELLISKFGISTVFEKSSVYMNRRSPSVLHQKCVVWYTFFKNQRITQWFMIASRQNNMIDVLQFEK